MDLSAEFSAEEKAAYELEKQAKLNEQNLNNPPAQNAGDFTVPVRGCKRKEEQPTGSDNWKMSNGVEFPGIWFPSGSYVRKISDAYEAYHEKLIDAISTDAELRLDYTNDLARDPGRNFPWYSNHLINRTSRSRTDGFPGKEFFDNDKGRKEVRPFREHSDIYYLPIPREENPIKVFGTEAMYEMIHSRLDAVNADYPLYIILCEFLFTDILFQEKSTN